MTDTEDLGYRVRVVAFDFDGAKAIDQLSEHGHTPLSIQQQAQLLAQEDYVVNIAPNGFVAERNGPRSLYGRIVWTLTDQLAPLRKLPPITPTED